MLGEINVLNLLVHYEDEIGCVAIGNFGGNAHELQHRSEDLKFLLDDFAQCRHVLHEAVEILSHNLDIARDALQCLVVV